MPRILIASALESARSQLAQVLGTAGFVPFRSCGSAGEVRRTLSACDHALLIMAGLLPDTSPEDLLCDFHHQLQILLIARPAVIEVHNAHNLFHLSYPCTGQSILGAVEMLTQLYDMNHPQRSQPDRQLVEAAKQILIRNHGMTEPQAHSHMQHYAMAHGLKMTDYARQILNKSGST